MKTEKIVIHIRVPRFVVDGMRCEKELEGFSYPSESARRALCRYYKNFFRKNPETSSSKD